MSRAATLQGTETGWGFSVQPLFSLETQTGCIDIPLLR